MEEGCTITTSLVLYMQSKRVATNSNVLSKDQSSVVRLRTTGRSSKSSNE